MSSTTSSSVRFAETNGDARSRRSEPPPGVRTRSRRSQRVGAGLSLLLLLPLYIVLPIWINKLHYQLPVPKSDLFDIHTGLPQLSEKAILGHSKYLSETIGFRTVGTKEHAAGDKYVYDQAKLIEEACIKAVKSAPTRRLECEVWRQEGSGSHRFDMMGKPLFKVYENLSNIIIRISNGTPAGKANALLLNSHVDSTVSSPGASDDAISVGVMLEIARVLVNTPNWEPNHAIVFLFNNAEESLQDGSHLFATQHPLISTVRAVVNLEAAGNTGPEILFQATSEEMIRAYSKVPYPYATVMANDVFKSGILLSDTDFRQFEEYQNLTGLDMAIVGDSYLYHTRKDLVKHIQPGVSQHFAENVYAIVQYLTTSPESGLAHLGKYVSPPTSLYFSMGGQWFFLYSEQSAWRILATIFMATLLLQAATTKFDDWPIVGRAFLGILGSILGSVAGAGVSASVMAKLLGAGMSWYSREKSPLILYGPPALTGALAAQYFLTSRSSPVETAQFEYATMFALHIFNLGSALLLQSFSLGTSSTFTIFAVGSLIALLINAVVNSVQRRVDWYNVNLVAYAAAHVLPIVVGTEIAIGFLDIFVPLTGRMGEVAPVEHIIAIGTAIMGFQIVSFTLPLAHKLRRSVLLSTILGLSVFSGVVMLVFAFAWAPFDAMHQKRMFVLHYEDLTKTERHLHLASADGAPGFPQIVGDIADKFAQIYHRPVPVLMDDNNADWDIVYPFSQFLTPYKIPLPNPYDRPSPFAKTFTVTATNDIVNHRTQTRSLTLVIDHPGIIWTTIAFDANILKWSIASPPLQGLNRYHIKEASYYGTDQWTIDMVISVPPNDPNRGRLTIDFMGIIERGSWPGKTLDRDDGPAMFLFEELDSFMYHKTGDSVDVMLLGCVGGEAVV